MNSPSIWTHTPTFTWFWTLVLLSWAWVPLGWLLWRLLKAVLAPAVCYGTLYRGKSRLK